MRHGIVAILLATVLVATIAVFFAAERYFQAENAEEIASRLSLYQRSLNETLRQHQHLPFVLARDQMLAAALQGGDTAALNERFRSYAEQSDLEAIYLMDRDGSAISASNFDQPHSFVGQNYGFRPYFQTALSGERSDYFAIGATTGRPGYFVAEPVTLDDGRIVGVIAIKLDISELQASWESSGEPVLAVNPDGIIVLASNPQWLYHSISALDASDRESILASRQFGDLPLPAIPWTAKEDGRLEIDGMSHLSAQAPAEWQDWTIYYLRPEGQILRQTLLATLLFGAIVSLLIGFATYLRSIRIQLALNESQRHRHALLTANDELQKAQAELSRTTKLATLGQLAASVTHELGQPISAFRNHLAAAELGDEIRSPETAESFKKLVDRMEAVIGQLRFFAIRGERLKKPVSTNTMLLEVRQLVEHDMESAGIAFSVEQDSPDLQVLGDQLQLEQVLINLLRNAIHAVENRKNPAIRISVRKATDNAEITVGDNGGGLNGVAMPQLREPFYSTKPSGVGMGLGLSIATQIVEEHEGSLRVGDCKTHGAEFVVSLPLAHGDPR